MRVSQVQGQQNSGQVVRAWMMAPASISLAIEELRTGSPADWVSIARNPSGRFGAVFYAIHEISLFMEHEHMHLVAATPRLLDVFLDFLRAFEAAGSVEDANFLSVFECFSYDTPEKNSFFQTPL